MKIRDFELKNKTVLEIGKFAILCNWFEKEYCENNCNYSRLKDAFENVRIDSKKQKELADGFEVRKYMFMQVTEEYVDTGLYPDNARRTRTDAEERKVMEDFIDQKEGDTTLGCLMTIYRIRCNMMHGLKIVEQLDDQYELFKAVNGVLESIR